MDIGAGEEFKIEGEADFLLEIQNFLFAEGIVGYYGNSTFHQFRCQHKAAQSQRLKGAYAHIVPLCKKQIQVL